MQPVIVIPPAVEPISTDDAKYQARIFYDPADPIAPSEDSLVASLITAARMSVEARTNRTLITTTWDWVLDSWPMASMVAGGRYVQSLNMPPIPLSEIRIPNPDLVSVVSINYVDSAGNMQILDPSMYTVIPAAPGRIFPSYGKPWPAIRSWPGSITVRYTAGFGPAPTDVPECARNAIKMIVAGLYQNREWQTPTGNNAGLVPQTVDALLAPIMWGAYT